MNAPRIHCGSDHHRSPMNAVICSIQSKIYSWWVSREPSIVLIGLLHIPPIQHHQFGIVKAIKVNVFIWATYLNDIQLAECQQGARNLLDIHLLCELCFSIMFNNCIGQWSGDRDDIQRAFRWSWRPQNFGKQGTPRWRAISAFTRSSFSCWGSSQHLKVFLSWVSCRLNLSDKFNSSSVEKFLWFE